MSPIYGNNFSIWQNSNIRPVNFLIAKTWPPMCLTFHKQFTNWSPNGCFEERFACDGVIIGRCLGQIRILLLFKLLFGPCDIFSERVACMFRIVSIVAANARSQLWIAVAKEAKLGWIWTSAFCFSRHHTFGSHHRFWILLCWKGFNGLGW